MQEQLRTLLDPVVTAMGYELIGVEFFKRRSQSLLRVYIDHEQGIGLDDCEQVSHQVSAVLDVDDPVGGAYALEVSSPGLDRPLFITRHYEQFIGEVARIEMRMPIAGQRRFQGTLQGVEGDAVLIECDQVAHRLPLAQIGKARLVPRFPDATEKT